MTKILPTRRRARVSRHDHYHYLPPVSRNSSRSNIRIHGPCPHCRPQTHPSPSFPLNTYLAIPKPLPFPYFRHFSILPFLPFESKPSPPPKEEHHTPTPPTPQSSTHTHINKQTPKATKAPKPKQPKQHTNKQDRESTHSFCASIIINVLSLTLAVDGGTPIIWRKDWTCVADAMVDVYLLKLS